MEEGLVLDWIHLLMEDQNPMEYFSNEYCDTWNSTIFLENMNSTILGKSRFHRTYGKPDFSGKLTSKSRWIQS